LFAHVCSTSSGSLGIKHPHHYPISELKSVIFYFCRAFFKISRFLWFCVKTIGEIVDSCLYNTSNNMIIILRLVDFFLNQGNICRNSTISPIGGISVQLGFKVWFSGHYAPYSIQKVQSQPNSKTDGICKAKPIIWFWHPRLCCSCLLQLHRIAQILKGCKSKHTKALFCQWPCASSFQAINEIFTTENHPLCRHLDDSAIEI
jgi:hypothetical protein